jgi:hypothetical protein
VPILDKDVEELVRRIEHREVWPPVPEWEWRQRPDESASMAAGRLYAEIQSSFPEVLKVCEGFTLPMLVHLCGFIAETYRKHFPDG